MLLEIQKTMSYGRGDNLGLEDLFAEMTDEGLEQTTQTQEMDPGEEVIPDVQKNELFEDYMEVDNTQREITRTQAGRVINWHTHLDDYGV